MAKTLKQGDPVLVYGRLLTVTSLEETPNGLLAKCKDLAGEKVRENARQEVLRLREHQKNTAGSEHSAIAADIERVSKQASAALFHFGLRADLLAWWEEKQCWVSDGRILSDAQQLKWTSNPAIKVPAHQQRKVLIALEASGDA